MARPGPCIEDCGISARDLHGNGFRAKTLQPGAVKRQEELLVCGNNQRNRHRRTGSWIDGHQTSTARTSARTRSSVAAA